MNRVQRSLKPESSMLPPQEKNSSLNNSEIKNQYISIAGLGHHYNM